MIRVTKGLVEIKTTDPTLRSFLVPTLSGVNRRVNIWKTKRMGYTMGVCYPNKTYFTKCLTESDVKYYLKNYSKGNLK